MINLKNGDRVEVLVNGQWLPATFCAADMIDCSPHDEAWWMDHFVLDNGDTIPDDVQSGELPQWRQVKSTARALRK
jgi:hypothetical protein